MMCIEMSCYDEILDFYQDKSRSTVSTQLWLDGYLIKLMNILSTSQNPKYVKNCIIVMLSLFKDSVPDHYHTRGKSTEELKSSEKKYLYRALELELNN